MKKIFSIFLIIILATQSAFAFEESDFQKELDSLSSHIKTTVSSPSPSAVGGEWTIVGLSAKKDSIPEEYFNIYLSNLKNLLNEKSGILSTSKNTEYSRAIIALSSIGENASDFYGYNLITPILNYEKTTKQGVNGAVWALIALESGNYYPEEKELRKKYIEKILSMQSENGGFCLSKSFQADPDVTAMAIQALSFYKNNKTILDSITKSENFLKKIKNFPSSESVAQAITALTSLGKNSSDMEIKRLLNILSDFRCETNGYCHQLLENEEKKENIMATEQVLCALSSLKAADETGEWIYSFKKSFDDISDCIYKNEVEILSKKRIISGRDEKMFFPKSEILWSELYTIAAKALQLEIKAEASTDITESSWYYPYVCAIYSNKITENEDSDFSYENKVSYQKAYDFFKSCADFLKKESFNSEFFQKDGYITREEAAKSVYEIIK